MKSGIKTNCLKLAIAFVAIASLIPTTGCQSNYAGQTLPSAYFLKDDLQYFVKGPQHKLHREAAALQAARADEMSRRR